MRSERERGREPWGIFAIVLGDTPCASLQRALGSCCLVKVSDSEIKEVETNKIIARGGRRLEHPLLGSLMKSILLPIHQGDRKTRINWTLTVIISKVLLKKI